MEQTFEGGEKHLPLLKDICGEALPGFTLREHSLDHERDLFVMDFDGPDGARRRVCWTRMVLFDAERIPTLEADPAAVLRAKIVELVRAQAAKTEILVTFRHLEEGWVDTPEPRRDGRRRRRGRGGRGGERGGERAGGQGGRPQGGPREPGRDRDRRPGGPAPAQPPRGGAPGQRTGGGERRPGGPPPSASGAGEPGAGGGKRRRRRRRRGGRGPGGGPPGGAPPAPQGPRP